MMIARTLLLIAFLISLNPMTAQEPPAEGVRNAPGPTQLDSGILDPAADKKDVYFVPMNQSQEYLCLYHYKQFKQLVAIRIVFSPSTPLSAAEAAQLRALTLRFLHSVRKIEVLSTAPNKK